VIVVVVTPAAYVDARELERDRRTYRLSGYHRVRKRASVTSNETNSTIARLASVAR
jgi:hypothetical protein